MPSAFDVAYHLIRLAGDGKESDPLTNLRLQKLLYYVQGWAIAALGRPMFDQPIEAWTYGPVVRDLYNHFKEHGRDLISPEQVPTANGVGDEDRAFIESVWDSYKQYSATALVSMTHEEAPWQDARKGMDDQTHSDREITPDSLQQWFAQKLQTKLIPSLPVVAAYKAVADLERQPSKRHDEVFAALRKGRKREPA
jgi:uncharacterized phage-associated protein